MLLEIRNQIHIFYLCGFRLIEERYLCEKEKKIEFLLWAEAPVSRGSGRERKGLACLRTEWQDRYRNG